MIVARAVTTAAGARAGGLACADPDKAVIAAARNMVNAIVTMMT
jgi:hypothetical protein